MYVNITGSSTNKDVYIYQSYRKENGKTSSKIYRKLGKYNDLLKEFNGNHNALMSWAKSEASKGTEEYNNKSSKVSVAVVRQIGFYNTLSFRGNCFLYVSIKS